MDTDQDLQQTIVGGTMAPIHAGTTRARADEISQLFKSTFARR